jgi:HEAT repeat protein
VSEPRLALALLGQVLEGPTPEVRAAAREVLARQGFDLEGLARSALAPADKSASQRLLAVNLAAGLGVPDAPGLLDKLLKDPDEPAEVYRHVVAALRRLGPDGTAVLAAHAQHPREDVRRWIAEKA